MKKNFPILFLSVSCLLLFSGLFYITTNYSIADIVVMFLGGVLGESPTECLETAKRSYLLPPSNLWDLSIHAHTASEDIYWSIYSIKQGKGHEISGKCTKEKCEINLDEKINIGEFTDIGYINFYNSVPSSEHGKIKYLDPFIDTKYQFSPDGQWLAYILDNKVNLYRRENNNTYKLATTKRVSFEHIYDINGNGDILVSAGEFHNDIQVYIFDGSELQSQELIPVSEIAPYYQCITMATFWDYDKIFYSLGEDGLHLFELNTQNDVVFYKPKDEAVRVKYDIQKGKENFLLFSDGGNTENSLDIYQINVNTKNIENLTNSDTITELIPTYYGNSQIVFWAFDSDKQNSNYYLETINLETMERKRIMKIDFEEGIIISK